MLKEKIKALPLLPGCYLFKNKDGIIIYVGKSKKLRNRVRQYFNHKQNPAQVQIQKAPINSNRPPNIVDDKIPRLVKEIVDLDFVVTENETEALILEHQLIKKYWPKYNSQMKNNRAYPFLKINSQLEYPALTLTYSAGDDADYFGCFRNEDSAIYALELISKVWKTPTCNKEFSKTNNRACLRYHLNACVGACSQEIEPTGYKQVIEEVISFLRGNSSKKLEELKNEMMSHSNDLNFEKAAEVKNTINNLEWLMHRSKRFNTILEGKTICLFIRAFNEDGFSLYYIVNGKVLIHFRNNSISEISASLIDNFVDCIFKSEYNVSNGDVLAKSLTDILADKLYIEFFSDITPRTAKQLLHDGLSGFTCD